ncbi:hypothetical protein [Candidatus Nitrososphaera evergladensis]|uniref:hypothetical protein n=1 Tax=Candidatus Nitrososphaera evergladensis TaxID=1459637 RepID=UPI0011E5A212|nr:hypothetical protein [Candidatus Nitrososphaera evergladensis]
MSKDSIREALYERLRSLGVNVETLKKFNLTDEELLDFANRLTKLVNKSTGGILLVILGLVFGTTLRV